ncbi:MAG: YceD family protein [Gammaproteobacteria bacterium]|nr:YceD family protein [Gammaproteobacteria bacterium]
MVNVSLPKYIDARKVFLQRERVSGLLKLSDLRRLRGLLANDRGTVYAELRFFLDGSGNRIIKGKVKATLNVICQRCLEQLEILIGDDISLGVIESEDLASGLDSTLDPWICSGYKLSLSELVEEQLILCLPIVNHHEDSDCTNKLNYQANVSAKKGDSSKDSPFAVLKTLKTKSL